METNLQDTKKDTIAQHSMKHGRASSTSRINSEINNVPQERVSRSRSIEKPSLEIPKGSTRRYSLFNMFRGKRPQSTDELIPPHVVKTDRTLACKSGVDSQPGHKAMYEDRASNTTKSKHRNSIHSMFEVFSSYRRKSQPSHSFTVWHDGDVSGDPRRSSFTGCGYSQEGGVSAIETLARQVEPATMALAVSDGTPVPWGPSSSRRHSPPKLKLPDTQPSFTTRLSSATPKESSKRTNEEHPSIILTPCSSGEFSIASSSSTLAGEPPVGTSTNLQVDMVEDATSQTHQFPAGQKKRSRKQPRILLEAGNISKPFSISMPNRLDDIHGLDMEVQPHEGNTMTDTVGSPMADVKDIAVITHRADSEPNLLVDQASKDRSCIENVGQSDLIMTGETTAEGPHKKRGRSLSIGPAHCVPSGPSSPTNPNFSPALLATIPSPARSRAMSYDLNMLQDQHFNRELFGDSSSPTFLWAFSYDETSTETLNAEDTSINSTGNGRPTEPRTYTARPPSSPTSSRNLFGRIFRRPSFTGKHFHSEDSLNVMIPYLHHAHSISSLPKGEQENDLPEAVLSKNSQTGNGIKTRKATGSLKDKGVVSPLLFQHSRAETQGNINSVLLDQGNIAGTAGSGHSTSERLSPVWKQAKAPKFSMSAQTQAEQTNTSKLYPTKFARKRAGSLPNALLTELQVLPTSENQTSDEFPTDFLEVEHLDLNSSQVAGKLDKQAVKLSAILERRSPDTAIRDIGIPSHSKPTGKMKGKLRPRGFSQDFTANPVSPMYVFSRALKSWW